MIWCFADCFILIDYWFVRLLLLFVYVGFVDRLFYFIFVLFACALCFV